MSTRQTRCSRRTAVEFASPRRASRRLDLRRHQSNCVCVPRQLKTPEGIFARHSSRCSAHGGGRCSCASRFQASAWSARDRKPVPAYACHERRGEDLAGARCRSRFRTVPPARPRTSPSPRPAEAWLIAARAGVIRTRSGDPYRPSALRSYEQARECYPRSDGCGRRR
jgi:hypothetical protein